MLLLGQDNVALYPPSVNTDEHGWRLRGDLETWSGVGNLQLQPGISIPTASTSGGRGPFGPARDKMGQLFLPPEAPVLEGSVAVIGDPNPRIFVLNQTRLVNDPLLPEGLRCWSATAISIDTWPTDEGE